MRESAYGRQVVFYWEGLKGIDDVVITPVASTLTHTGEEQKEIDAKAKELQEDPFRFNGYLWRFEGVNETGRKLMLKVSPIRYAEHDALRRKKLAMERYPNPLGVTVGQETADGYFPLGVQGTGDNRELVLLGSGFIERPKDGTSLEDAVRRECFSEETSYGGNKFYDAPEFLENTAQVVAITFGSRKDTGVVMRLPLPVTSREVGLGDEEHSELLFLPNSPATVTEVMGNGSYKSIPATDQLIGFLERYSSLKETGRLVSAYQHQ